MALRLTIISEQAAELGEHASVVFEKAGGTIGRAGDNRWVLPDRLRYISSHHARISYRNGSFIVEDTSTNGLFLNDEIEPVGRLGPQPLRPGDRLRLGAYQIAVRDNDSPVVEASAIVAYRAPNGETAGLDYSGSIGVNLDISELLTTDPDASAARRAFDPWGNPVSDSALLQFDIAQKTGSRKFRPTTPAAPALAPAPAPAPATAAAPASPAARNKNVALLPASAGQAALEAFCRGAGLKNRTLNAEAQDRLLGLAGLLLRETLVGIKELARTQREIRQGAGLRASGDDPERLALQNLPVEELLVRLLFDHEQQQLDAVQWMRELFALAIRHDAALMRALRPALTEFTQRLDPALLSPGRAGTERFRSITEAQGDRLPHLFAEALARSFNVEIEAPGGD
ncbi:MAG TPA: type VI secretion system-associated FHA domain protein TagH [Steroidobacteraceae bacterium]|nr:type VI secretion system-associated FHA domain protein TagH [Steroidobacteraceae bacterium]